MTDFEFGQFFFDMYDKAVAGLKDEDYEVNPEQAEKFNKIIAFFRKSVSEYGGEINSISLTPVLERGCVTATLLLVTVSGEEVKEFCSALSEASAITMDATDDGVCISVTVPHVFRRKSE